MVIKLQLTHRNFVFLWDIRPHPAVLRDYFWPNVWALFHDTGIQSGMTQSKHALQQAELSPTLYIEHYAVHTSFSTKSSFYVS